MKDDTALREQLVGFLSGGKAHMTLADAVKNFPINEINNHPRNVDYTFWHLLEHIRFTQFDIVDFISNPNYKEPKWPDDYWPAKDAVASEKDWLESIQKYESDLKKMIAIVNDTTIDLNAKIPNGDGQTVLREALLIIDHAAYHVGEFAILRQVEKNWK